MRRVVDARSPAGSPGSAARRPTGRRRGPHDDPPVRGTPGLPGTSSGSPVAASVTSALPSTPTARPPSRRTRSTRTRGTIRAPAAMAVARWTRMPDCFVPRVQPNGQLPQSSQSVAFRRVGRGLPAERVGAPQDRGVLRRDAGRLGHAQLRLHRRDVALPAAPVDAVEAVLGRPLARTASGATMLVIQLTSVPPPTPLPDSMVIAPSQVASRPWLRYRRSNASSSFVGIVRSSTNGPASSTTTDRPASASAAATTPPPAPEPTTTASASRTIGSSGEPVVERQARRDDRGRARRRPGADPSRSRSRRVAGSGRPAPGSA